MSALITAILAMLPNIFIGILSKFVSEKFLQAVLEKVLIYGLKHAARLTTNTVDDELVADIEKRLKEEPEK